MKRETMHTSIFLFFMRERNLSFFTPDPHIETRIHTTLAMRDSVNQTSQPPRPAGFHKQTGGLPTQFSIDHARTFLHPH